MWSIGVAGVRRLGGGGGAEQFFNDIYGYILRKILYIIWVHYGFVENVFPIILFVAKIQGSPFVVSRYSCDGIIF